MRTWDLVTQKSSLEYCWDPIQVDISEARQQNTNEVSIKDIQGVPEKITPSFGGP